MPDSWTGAIVGKMHNKGITYNQLANKLGVTKSYVSMILSGARKPSGAKERFIAAINEIVAENSNIPANNS